MFYASGAKPSGLVEPAQSRLPNVGSDLVVVFVAIFWAKTTRRSKTPSHTIAEATRSMEPVAHSQVVHEWIWFEMPVWHIKGHDHPLTADEQDGLLDFVPAGSATSCCFISGLPRPNVCGEHTLPAARGKHFLGRKKVE